jgi:hypothetical protein
MPNGHSPSDWTVKWDGTNGTVACPPYAARFTVLRTGVIRLVWISGPTPGPGYGAVERAAREAAEMIVG